MSGTTRPELWNGERGARSTRRELIGAAIACSLWTPAGLVACPREQGGAAPSAAGAQPFEISLAQWSLHKRLFGRKGDKLDNLDFAETAKGFGIGAIEYVNSFFKDKVGDREYLRAMKKRADEHGVRSLLIMCDGLGWLGAPEAEKRAQTVENHRPWLAAAKFLGCHSIRVNAASRGSYDEQMKLAADGLAKLTEHAAELELNVLVENHGGLSSNGAWLAGVMKLVDMPRFGTLPDFGNFRTGQGRQYDRYKGVYELMPYAKAVSAKSHDFDEDGFEVHTDYRRMLRIVHAAGYRGYVGIEYEGRKLSEDEGIRATKRLLERVRAELAARTHSAEPATRKSR